VPEAAERTQAPGGEAASADLESRVRTAAHAANGETEFLEQLHAQGVVVRPRFATGDSTTVVGMSVALSTGDTGNTLDWHGAGKLGSELSLPALRERWGQTPEQQGAAVDAWRQLGAVGSAARRMARCAQDPRSGPRTGEVIPARAAPRMSLTSAALLGAATGKAQHAGWVAVFHALARTAQAVAAAQRSHHAAAWETQAAAQAAERVLAYAGRMDAVVTAAATPPPAAPAPDGLTDAERNVRDVMAGRRTKTIRQIVDTAATSTTRADRGQGGKKPDRGRGGQHR